MSSRLRLHKQPDNSFESDPAPTDGVYELIVAGLSGKLYIVGVCGLRVGEIILWDGRTLKPGLDVFEEGHDPIEEFFGDIRHDSHDVWREENETK